MTTQIGWASKDAARWNDGQIRGRKQTGTRRHVEYICPDDCHYCSGPETD